jgi:hypothetical protein
MRPFDETDFPRAALLLHEGFPHLSVPFWAGALKRLRDYAGNEEAQVPLGWFMLAGDEAVGVVLTPASVRLRPDGAGGSAVQRVVNLSSWYVRPHYRWRAGFMLRAILSDRATIYTDLTATPDVQKMLPVLGFSQINRGVALHFLPLTSCLPARGASVRLLTDAEPAALPGPPPAMVRAHRELGCLPLVLETPHGSQLLVCKIMRIRGLRAAQLIYAERQSELLRHRGALARCLLRRGVLLFAHDARAEHGLSMSWFRRRDLWFARGGSFEDSTDAFASELCIVHAAVLPSVKHSATAAC